MTENDSFGKDACQLKHVFLAVVAIFEYAEEAKDTVAPGEGHDDGKYAEKEDWCRISACTSEIQETLHTNRGRPLYTMSSVAAVWLRVFSSCFSCLGVTASTFEAANRGAAMERCLPPICVSTSHPAALTKAPIAGEAWHES
ncbi:hypothetical protein VDGL01_06211 [Verticillium dahliae]